MATDRNIVNMVEAIRKGNSVGAIPGGVDHICMATVSSVEPLSIQMHNLTISKNLFINPALTVEASGSGEKINQIFQTSFATPEAYNFLKEFHLNYVLKAGDTVIVCVMGNAFYIVGKAVRI